MDIASVQPAFLFCKKILQFGWISACLLAHPGSWPATGHTRKYAKNINRVGQSIVDKHFFSQCAGLHVLLTLMLGLKSTGWWAVGCCLTICTINFIFVSDGLTAAAERVAGLADVLRRYIDHTCSCFQLRFRGGVHLCEREGREI
jgi:hypothetical protein